MAGTQHAPVALLVGRLVNASQISERVDALEAIKSLSVMRAKEVGRVALPLLAEMLHAQPRDASVLRSALGALDVLCRAPDAAAGGSIATASVNAEFILNGEGTVDSLLDLLAERDMWVRLNAITLLSTLAGTRPQHLGKAIEGCHAGMEKLMRVLEDHEEEVRNLLLMLLLSLTRSNVAVQNYCAFNDCFDRFWGIMHEEGVWDGGAVVQDCLCILANIVTENEMTGKLFMLSRCCSEIKQLVRPQHLSSASPPQRVEMSDWLVAARAQCIVSHLVRYVAENVSPSAGGTEMTRELRRRRVAQLNSVQAQLADAGYLKAICAVALDYSASTVVVPLEALSAAAGATLAPPRSVEVQPAALRLLGNMVRGCERAQRLLNDNVATYAPQEGMLPVPVASCLVQVRHCKGVTCLSVVPFPPFPVPSLPPPSSTPPFLSHFPPALPSVPPPSLPYRYRCPSTLRLGRARGTLPSSPTRPSCTTTRMEWSHCWGT
jgi:hypothetical protein